ncbi:MAG: AraC family transcriptional regulator [Gordonia sp. (in: high G+C Gram-positive bacteria)]|jgi:AraC-like DNA-binding protein|nr:AraC family transcriptional regulator [Gordonia sp. (in: high G+C Gram-positive bacteria)]
MGDFQTSIRDIGYSPDPGVGSVDVTAISDIREAAAHGEFTGSQRLGFELIVAVESGTTDHDVDFTTYSLTEGHVLWVHAGQIQEWGDIHAIEGVMCMFPTSMISPADSDVIGAHGGWRRSHWAPSDGRFTRDFRALLDMQSRVAGSAFADAILAHLLSATVLAMATAADDPLARVVGDDRVRQFRNDVDVHYLTDRSVGFYARRLACSERSLHRLVTAGTGLTPRQVIEQRIVLEAQRMLVHQGSPVATIARALGYDDQSNFATMFKRSAGETPSMFRERHRAGGMR